MENEPWKPLYTVCICQMIGRKMRRTLKTNVHNSSWNSPSSAWILESSWQIEMDNEPLLSCPMFWSAMGFSCSIPVNRPVVSTFSSRCRSGKFDELFKTKTPNFSSRGELVGFGSGQGCPMHRVGITGLHHAAPLTGRDSKVWLKDVQSLWFQMVPRMLFLFLKFVRLRLRMWNFFVDYPLVN